MLREIVVLPEPDSPTSARTSCRAEVEADLEDDLSPGVRHSKVLHPQHHLTVLARIGVGHHAPRRVPRGQLGNPKTARGVAGADVDGRRLLLRAGLDGVRAAVPEAAAARPVPGARRPAGDAGQMMRPVEMGDRLEQGPRVGMGRAGEDRGGGPLLDEAPGV